MRVLCGFYGGGMPRNRRARPRLTAAMAACPPSGPEEPRGSHRERPTQPAASKEPATAPGQRAEAPPRRHPPTCPGAQAVLGRDAVELLGEVADLDLDAVAQPRVLDHLPAVRRARSRKSAVARRAAERGPGAAPWSQWLRRADRPRPRRACRRVVGACRSGWPSSRSTSQAPWRPRATPS